jgi:hypothetical protein
MVFYAETEVEAAKDFECTKNIFKPKKKKKTKIKTQKNNHEEEEL